MTTHAQLTTLLIDAAVVRTMARKLEAQASRLELQLEELAASLGLDITVTPAVDSDD